MNFSDTFSQPMDKRLIQNFARSYSIETTVREAKRVERFADVVPRGTWIYIAHIPGTDLQETVELAMRLRRQTSCRGAIVAPATAWAR